MKNSWETKLDKITNEWHLWENVFGFDTKFDIKKYLRKIEKLGNVDGCFCEIDIINSYSVKIKLPDYWQGGEIGRENILLYILTTSPIPSKCKFNKRKDELILEWI